MKYLGSFEELVLMAVDALGEDAYSANLQRTLEREARRPVSLGVDSNGGNGYTARWSYDDQPLLAHLIVRATGPGGTTDKVVGVYHPEQQS